MEGIIVSGKKGRQVAVSLRGHHLLCVQGFKGVGYSRRFVEGVWSLWEAIQDPESVIQLVSGCDSACGYCEHQGEDDCAHPSFGKMVSAQDRKVLVLLGLEGRTEVSAGELRASIGRKLKSDLLAEICGNCPWLKLGHCHRALDELEEKYAVGH